MIEKLKDLPRGIDGVRAIGKISKEDYEQVFVPFLDEARREGRHIRFIYQIGPEFEGFTPGAAWEDAKIGIHFLRLFDGCAVVTDLAWIRELKMCIRDRHKHLLIVLLRYFSNSPNPIDSLREIFQFLDHRPLL